MDKDTADKFKEVREDIGGLRGDVKKFIEEIATSNQRVKSLEDSKNSVLALVISSVVAAIASLLHSLWKE